MSAFMGWLTHHIHACQLGPYLSKDTDVGSENHIWFEEFEESRIGVVTLEFAHVLDILQLTGYEEAVGVSFTVD